MTLRVTLLGLAAEPLRRPVQCSPVSGEGSGGGMTGQMFEASAGASVACAGAPVPSGATGWSNPKV
ncbi:MAG: hypothetical protein NVS3B26_18730 [Mycobacteriales bacterium]